MRLWKCHGSEHAFVAFLLPMWADKVRADNKNGSGLPERREEQWQRHILH